MKIYLFDTETGIYLGEDFADEGELPGSYRMPAGATAIAPPERANGIPRFDQASQRWDILTPNRQVAGMHGRLGGEAARETKL